MNLSIIFACTMLFCPIVMDAVSTQGQGKQIKRGTSVKTRKKAPPKKQNPLANFNRQKKILENKKASLADRLHAAAALQLMIKKAQRDEFIAQARGLSLHKVNAKSLKIPAPKKLNKKTKQQINRSLKNMQIELSIWTKYLRKEAAKQSEKAAVTNLALPQVNTALVTKPPTVAPTSTMTIIGPTVSVAPGTVPAPTSSVATPTPASVTPPVPAPITLAPAPAPTLPTAVSVPIVPAPTRATPIVTPISTYPVPVPAPEHIIAEPPVPERAPIARAPIPIAPEHIIAEPPTIEEPQDRCQFCDNEHELHRLACGHSFCRDCLEQLVNAEEHPLCPICRQPMSDADITSIGIRPAPVAPIIVPAPEPIRPGEPPVAPIPAVAPGPEETQECPICATNVSADQMAHLSCDHTICRNCLRMLINTAVTSHENIRELRCPICNQPLSRTNIETFYPDKLGEIDRWGQEQWLTEHTDRIGRCPTPNCPYIFGKNSDRRQIIRCPQCRQEFCSRCMERHPANTRCHQNERFETRDIRHCPRCDRLTQQPNPIECDWVNCPCGQSFCVACGHTDEHYPVFHHFFRNSTPCPYPEEIPPASLPLAGAAAEPVSPPTVNLGPIRYGEPEPDVETVLANARY